MRAGLSLMGIYEFDSTVLDGFNYPAAWGDTEKETFINNLLFETAELEILYPDVRFMQLAIRSWSKKELPQWEKLYATTVLEYNPIWNKDGTITETRELSGGTIRDTKENINDTGSRTASGNMASESSSAAEGSASDNSTHSVWGYNGAGPSEDEKTESDRSTSGKETASATGSNSETESSTGERARTENENVNQQQKETTSRVEQGNIGVTTTQSMIREEREIDTFNLMDYIIDSFKKRFCILVY